MGEKTENENHFTALFVFAKRGDIREMAGYIHENVKLPKMVEFLSNTTLERANFLIAHPDSWESETPGLGQHVADFLNTADINGWTALTVAVSAGKLELADFLFEHGAKLSFNSLNEEGDRIPTWAANIKVSIEKSADVTLPTWRNGDSETILMRAAWSNNNALIQRVLQEVRKMPNAREYLNAMDRHYMTALRIAVIQGNADAVEMLLIAGANPRVLADIEQVRLNPLPEVMAWALMREGPAHEKIRQLLKDYSSMYETPLHLKGTNGKVGAQCRQPNLPVPVGRRPG
ncbi:MAG: hypothetical protein WC759_02745 [Candidatus Micrarchaeia archaeon]|jgi:ankyrin repeat protein